MGPEKKVENSIKRWLELKGCFVIKTLGGTPGTPAGCPDIITCYKGYVIFIEVKRTFGGVVSEIQKAQINKIRKGGNIAIVANDLKQVKNLIHQIESYAIENKDLINSCNELGVDF